MLTYEELFAEYTKALAENKRLTAENQSLRKQLAMPARSELHQITDSTDKQIYDKDSINKRSAPAEKIRLFMSLFGGRTDFLQYVGIAKQQKKAVIGLCVAMSGTRCFVIRKNISALIAQTESLCRWLKKIFTIILPARTHTAEMLWEYILC